MLSHEHGSPQRPSRVVVLGAEGFLGRRLVARLTADDVNIRAIGRSDVDLAAEDASTRLANELSAGDAVVFLSALTPDKGRDVPPFLANLRMGAAVADAIGRVTVGHLIYISSDAVYPFRSALIDENTPAAPIDLYGVMHLSRELMMKQATNAPVAILRPTLIFGAGDTHNSYGPNRFRRAAQKEGRITLFGEGEETRDHIFVNDVVALINLVLSFRSAGTLNLSTGCSIDYASLARLVAAHFPSKIEIAGTPRQNPITHRTFDVAAVFRSFPEFRFTPLEEALALTHQEDAA